MEMSSAFSVRRRRVREDLPGMDRAIRDARCYLLAIQREDGHWRGELEGDSILESEYVLTQLTLGQGDCPRVRKAAEQLRRTQRPDGGWSLYPGGAPDVSASVKAYFVLKLMGDDPASEPMARARETILRLGGIDACNSFTRIYLAIFGQYPWADCPAVPPELALLPRWSPFGLAAMSSWTRAIVVPLSIVWAHKPVVELPAELAIPELRVLGAEPVSPVDAAPGWERVFRFGDGLLKRLEAARLRPLRRLALRRAERWIVRRLRRSDGLAAIFPPIVNTILAFRAMGHGPDHPLVESQLAELERLVIEEEETLRVEPCFSPVWDTALSLNALLESGTAADDPAILRGARWLLDREVREAGDWSRGAPGVAPGGWYFEYANEFYPDCDDTAEVLTALAKVRFPDAGEERRRREATRRGLAWLLAMQSRNGGWASFDKNCDFEFLTHIPFADHNAMIDPPTADITARVLETLAVYGFEPSFPAVERALRFLLREQEQDGAWYGRWGCNYLYGTWLALHGLRSIGLEPEGSEWAGRGAAFLHSCQNLDGGWGELPDSYDEPSRRGRGPSTAAQTAWALLGLLAAGQPLTDAVRRGLTFLADRQEPDGSWVDEHWTGTGFPRVFYLRYHLYATYFPLLALGAWRRAADDPGGRVA